MGFKKVEDEFGLGISYPQYTETQLDEFAKWLQQFRETVDIPWKGERKIISPINYEEAAVKFGAMKKTVHSGKPTYAVILHVTEQDSHGNMKSFSRPTRYDLFQHKLKALESLQSRRKFVEEKKVEGLEDLAAGMRFDSHVEVDE